MDYTVTKHSVFDAYLMAWEGIHKIKWKPQDSKQYGLYFAKSKFAHVS